MLLSNLDKEVKEFGLKYRILCLIIILLAGGQTLNHSENRRRAVPIKLAIEVAEVRVLGVVAGRKDFLTLLE